MAISNDLFMAILSMDAYNRGYNQGLAGLGDVGSYIGTARIASQSNTTLGSSEVNASFFAQAYTLGNGKTVISYRGTDDKPNDALHGWSLATGNYLADQALLAAKFRQNVPASQIN